MDQTVNFSYKSIFGSKSKFIQKFILPQNPNLVKKSKLDQNTNVVKNLNWIEIQIWSKNLNNPKGNEKVSNMIKVASLTRKGFIAGDISTVMSPRTVLNWCSNSEIFKDVGYSFRVTFLNKCDESEKSTIAEYYQRCFGEDLPESMINIQV